MINDRHVLSLEHRNKIRLVHLDKKLSDEHRHKISIGVQNFYDRTKTISEKKCLKCGITFYKKDYECPTSFSRKKYCSYACGRGRNMMGKNNPRFGKTLSEATKLKIGLAHKGKKLRPCSEERKRRISEKAKERWTNNEFKQKMVNKRKGLKFTDEWRDNISLSRIGKKLPPFTKEHKDKLTKILQPYHFKKGRVPYNKGIPHSEEYKKKSSEIQKKKWQDEEYAKKRLKQMYKKPTKPEVFLMELIQENNLPFNYVGDGKIWFKGDNNLVFNPDFLSKNPKHIIEVFGDYWHNRQDMALRDINRIKTYNKYGYKTLIIWEHELVNYPRYGSKLTEQQIITKLRGFLNNDNR